jgi:CheY-like chemotaxis protein
LRVLRKLQVRPIASSAVSARLRATLITRLLQNHLRTHLQVPFDIAVNGAEAVRLILKEKIRYDFVLMDNQMPTMKGDMATRALRAGIDTRG